MAALVSTLPHAVGGGRKLSVVQAAITGTGAITTGLVRLDTGGAVVTVANSATSLTTDVAEETSQSAGTVNVSVTKLTFSGPTIALEGSAINVNCWSTGS
jgi:hypothetical protein